MPLAPGSPRRRERIRAQQIVLRLTPAYQLTAGSIDQDFAGPRSRIIVGCLRYSISPGDPYRQRIARLNLAERPIVQQTVPGFADLADDVHTLIWSLLAARFA